MKNDIISLTFGVTLLLLAIVIGGYVLMIILAWTAIRLTIDQIFNKK